MRGGQIAALDHSPDSCRGTAFQGGHDRQADMGGIGEGIKVFKGVGKFDLGGVFRHDLLRCDVSESSLLLGDCEMDLNDLIGP